MTKAVDNGDSDAFAQALADLTAAVRRLGDASDGRRLRSFRPGGALPGRHPRGDEGLLADTANGAGSEER